MFYPEDEKYIAIAEKYLQRYREAILKLDYLKDEEAIKVARAEGIKSSSYIESGWTGRYISDDDQKFSFKRKGKNQTRREPEKELVPLPGHTTAFGSQENALIELADYNTKVEQIKQQTNQIKFEIEEALDKALPAYEATMFKRRYLLFQSQNQIGWAMHCSSSNISRIIRKNLARFGAFLEKNK